MKIYIKIILIATVIIYSCATEKDEMREIKNSTITGKTLKHITPGVKTDSLNNKLVFVKGGTFQMGNNQGEIDEKPAHNVTISDFKIGKYEVTNYEYIKFLNEADVENDGTKNGVKYIDINNTKSSIKHDGTKFYFLAKVSKYNNCPVVYVTWEGANAYCQYYGGRLPTEAEWEYVSRGGAAAINTVYAGSNNQDTVAWFIGNSSAIAKSVGMKLQNELAISDMSGNVMEWCSDYYSADYYAISQRSNPTGPTVDKNNYFLKVLRGGSFNSNDCSVDNRSYGDMRNVNKEIGFRIVVDIN